MLGCVPFLLPPTTLGIAPLTCTSLTEQPTPNHCPTYSPRTIQHPQHRPHMHSS